MTHQREWIKCKRGHFFDEENTRVNYSGGMPRRVCRACERERARFVYPFKRARLNKVQRDRRALSKMIARQADAAREVGVW